MKASAHPARLLPLAAGVLLCSAGSASACAVCMGGDEKTGEALNGAIFLMLGFLGAMFTAIGAVAFSMWRRSRHPIPPHVQLAESVSEPGIASAVLQ